jgi:hypothetical protein
MPEPDRIFWLVEPPTDWSEALKKKLRLGCCRVCKARHRGLEAAHTISRRFQDQYRTVVVASGTAERWGKPYTYEERRKERYVPADAIVPLCTDCHRAYDAHELNLLPYMTYAEQANAVFAVGMVRALRLCTSGQ